MSRVLLAATAGLAALAVGARMPAAPPPVLAMAPGGLPAAHSLVRPVPSAILTQPFGCTSFELEPVDLACPDGHFHAGLDLAAPEGTEVRAAAPGAVVFANWTPDGYGLRLVLDHGRGLTTLYAHLLETAVAAGDLVAAGQRIAEVGTTGNSTGPHLHFEVRSNGRPADPEPLLAAIPTQGGTP